MIAALFALAATMIVAGVTAVVEGFPYVRLESGMAMVHAGAVIGSSGVLLAGLAVVATFLKRIERAVRGGAPVAAVEPPAETAGDPLIDELQIIAPSEPVERPRIEPSMASVSVREPASLQAEPDLPPAGLTLVQPPEATRPDRAPDVKPPDVRPPAPALAPRAPEPARPARIETEIAGLRSSLDPVIEPAADKIERTAVGRYSSGGNTYVMFDDGAIEAETPNGRFTFASLDELKAFVDGGGEKDARGAA